MHVERWSTARHLALLNQWLRARGMPETPGDAGLLPPLGAVADDCAACFLYTTDAHAIAYLDGLVTDPSVSHERRRAATRACFEHLADAAKGLGIRGLVACTRHAMPLEELQANGFKVHDSGLTWLVKAGE